MGSDWGMPRAHPRSRAVRPVTFKMSHPPGLLSCACRAGWSLLRAVPDSANENARHPLKLEFQTQLHTYSANGATSRRSEGRRDLRMHSSGLLPAKSPRAAHTPRLRPQRWSSSPVHCHGCCTGDRLRVNARVEDKSSLEGTRKHPLLVLALRARGLRGAGPLHAGVEGYAGRP